MHRSHLPWLLLNFVFPSYCILFILWLFLEVLYLFVHKIQTQICILASTQLFGSLYNQLIFSEWLKAHFKKHGVCTYSCAVLISLSFKREEKLFFKLSEVNFGGICFWLLKNWNLRRYCLEDPTCKVRQKLMLSARTKPKMNIALWSDSGDLEKLLVQHQMSF